MVKLVSESALYGLENISFCLFAKQANLWHKRQTYLVLLRLFWQCNRLFGYFFAARRNPRGATS